MGLARARDELLDRILVGDRRLAHDSPLARPLMSIGSLCHARRSLLLLPLPTSLLRCQLDAPPRPLGPSSATACSGTVARSPSKGGRRPETGGAEFHIGT